MDGIYQKIAVATVSALSLVAIETNEVVAATVTYDFTAEITRDVTGSSLEGQKFEGFFSYDDSMLTGIGQESLGGAAGVVNGVKVSFNFLGVTYTEALQKGDYPVVDVRFVDGKVDSFKYYFFDNHENTWFLLGGNHNTNVSSSSVGQVSYTLRQEATTPVPEPLTLLGSVAALGFGALLKQEHSRKHKKS